MLHVVDGDTVEEFLLFLKRSGMSDPDLAKDFNFLAGRSSAFAFARRHMLLGCSLQPAADTGSLHLYMDTFKSRRAKHLGQLSGVNAALAAIEPFKSHGSLRSLVVKFLFVPPRKLEYATRVACTCTAPRCRFKCDGVVPFLDHVVASHL